MRNNFKWIDDMLVMIDSNGNEIRPKTQDDRPREYLDNEVIDCLSYIENDSQDLEVA